MAGVDLAVFVSWILGGGFDVLVRWLVSLFPQVMADWTETQRAILSAVVGAVLQAGAFVLSVALGLLPRPDPDWLAWVSALFPYISLAIGVPAVMSTLFRRQAERSAGPREFGVLEAPNRWLGHRW